MLGNNSHESTRPATSLKPGTLSLEQITVRLREADAALGPVALLREDLAGEIERRRLSTTGDHAAATEMTQGAAPFVVMMSRLVAVTTTLSAAGRLMWGDSIGINRILDEMAAVMDRRAKPPPAP